MHQCKNLRVKSIKCTVFFVLFILFFDTKENRRKGEEKCPECNKNGEFEHEKMPIELVYLEINVQFTESTVGWRWWRRQKKRETKMHIQFDELYIQFRKMVNKSDWHFYSQLFLLVATKLHAHIECVFSLLFISCFSIIRRGVKTFKTPMTITSDLYRRKIIMTILCFGYFAWNTQMFQ